MTYQKPLELLLSGKTAWNKWRKAYADVQAFDPDLHEAQLSGVDLQGADLHRADDPYRLAQGRFRLYPAAPAGCRVGDARQCRSRADRRQFLPAAVCEAEVTERSEVIPAKAGIHLCAARRSSCLVQSNAARCALSET